MENKGLKLNTFNLILGIVGGIVTIVASIGGSYVTTQVVLARHEERIKVNTSDIKAIQSHNAAQLQLLNKIDKAVAVIEERTK
jgi:hypothetical protein